MAENLKQKLKKLNNIKWLILNAVIWLKCNCALAATKEENLSEEFFNAAMQVEAPAKNAPLTVDATTATNQAAAGKATEQAMAAEQVGDEAMLSGNNVLSNLKEYAQHAADKLQDFGNSIGHSLQGLTGGNPLITKILVAVILVIISIIIIVFLILIAKKFVFKKQNLEEFEDDEEFDESEFEDDEIQDIEDIDEDDNVEDIENNQPKVSHTKIPPRNKPQEPVQNQPKQPEVSTIPVQPQPVKHLATPDNIQTAIKIFLKVTED